MSIIRNFVVGIKVFFKSMGLVEQAQVVASTGVVIAMITIVTIKLVAGETLGALDFISVVTIGIFGFVGVIFALQYGRNLESQRKELLELNNIADAVNYSVDLTSVLQSALIKVMQLMHADAGWIYLSDHNVLRLRHAYGSAVPLFYDTAVVDDPVLRWINDPAVRSVEDSVIVQSTTNEFKNEGIKIIASIPLVRQGVFAGVLLIGGRDSKKFGSRKIAVIQAFGNQISMALNNAYLFEQVKESERQYADLYENSPDMYHSINRNGIIISCNETESRLLSIPKDRIIGYPLVTLYPVGLRPQVEANLKKIFMEGNQLKESEEQVVRHDGEVIDVSVNTSLVYDGDRKPIVARMVLRDITEKKKMEEKILQAQKIDSIGNLAGGIAHDFNNILTAILGSASIMRRKVDENNRLLKYVDLIETTARRGAAVTRQLLTFARKTNPHVVRAEVNSIIDQTIKLFEVTTPRTIHIKVNLAPEPLIVEADEGQLQQAFLNLCLNARDAMPNGGIIVITCAGMTLDQEQALEVTEGHPGSYVMISVADSGIGIPANVLSKIFEPFFTTKEQGKGTGLGLSVVYGVVKSHNGFINVKSEVNSGTIFTMYLPRVTGIKHGMDIEEKPEKIVGGNEKILIIEDEISVGEIGADILLELGYTVDVVHNGREAVEYLSRDGNTINLVLLDMNMPRMGGRATFDQIKNQFPKMKILVCSGYSATMIDDGKFTQAIDGFIQKPYELNDFAYKIRSILDQPYK
jgi:PAS domain S-box-containing protein